MNNLFDRKYIIQGLILLVCLILLGKLFYIQVFSDKYFLAANNNVLKRLYVYPARGVILDRNNKILAQNEPVYDLMVIPSQVKEIDTMLLCEIVGISKEDFIKNMRKARAQSNYRPTPFKKQLSVNIYAALQERLFLFPGFMVQSRSIRVYPDSLAGHMLGYVKEVDSNDINRSEGYYRPGDVIGKTGVERSYENVLRGQRGVINMLYDAKNVAQGSFQNGAFDTLAVNGEKLVSSIDKRIQELGEQLMKDKVGSIVAIEPSTGEVLAFVSSPGYNPNKMVGTAFGNSYMELFANPYRPSNIRPIQGLYSPGSAFKPLDALIALQNGVIDPNTTFYCPHYYKAGNRIVKCEHFDGSVNLRYGIAKSCNTYFCNIFAKLITRNGMKNQRSTYETWQEQVRKFGVGDVLGIDVPFEKSGKLYREADYNKDHGKRWGYTTIISLAIGQGEMNTTPLQMANIMAIIANRGYYIRPHLIKAIGDKKLIRKIYTEKHYAGIDARHFEPVIDGMQDCVNSAHGTAIESRIPGILMCGKTGTVQNSRGKNHSVFIGFAPRDNPKIAIA
ncbi:MAG: penicillin-binding protein 2, partial [Chitinophagaceae bacterium]